MREAVFDHGRLIKVGLENNAMNMRDIDDINRICRKNRESVNNEKIPKFKQELQHLIVTNKKKELDETVRMLNMVKENKFQIGEKIDQIKETIVDMKS